METKSKTEGSKGIFPSLNRTMQYGNYTFHYFFDDFWMFKSYYVVWKPAVLYTSSPIFPAFKSYYVVWKQEGKIYGQLGVYEFKSYYVVWKRRYCSFSSKPLPGLNRTMQYGNDIIRIFRMRNRESLNRTMQYGNAHG